jgi:hypothetical protein
LRIERRPEWRAFVVARGDRFRTVIDRAAWRFTWTRYAAGP